MILLMSAILVSACSDPYPWPKAPAGGPIVDGPYKDCLYASGYGDITFFATPEGNERALDICEGVPFDY